MMNRITSTVLSLICVVSLAGCNTVEGIGKDIKKGGDAIEKAASK